MNLFDTVGGRRFIYVFILALLTVGLKAGAAISDDCYSAIILGLAGLYVTGNVVQRFIESKAPKSES